MKIKFITCSALCFISIFTAFSLLQSGNFPTSAVSLSDKEGNQPFPGEESYMAASDPIVLDDFEFIEGLESTIYNDMRFIQLVRGSKKGRAERYFFDRSGKYDITLFYIDESNGKSVVEVTINGQIAGTIPFDSNKTENGQSSYSSARKEKVIPGVNIQLWSKIALEINGDGDERCRIEKLVLTPVGAFDGKVVRLEKPVSLQVYETANEQLMGRRVFSNFVRTQTDSLAEKRKSELSRLKNPAEWKTRQQKTRESLDKIFGEFPARTPLNARVTGKLDYKLYTIEKIIFESQPKYYVTANLYVPKDRTFPLPGILFTCGHDGDGKACILYHETCLGLVLKGYVVLAYDPMGQGERSEYIDNESKKNLVGLNVSQHHYISRPSFLVDWTLAGLRVWDGIRAVDYLVSRPEVDKDKLGVTGNSGGGQMTLMITAVDERIKVCAAAHPGGSMEQSYLSGQSLAERELFSLIPPRPARIIVGDSSGEEQGHRRRLEDMQLFYEGLGYKKERGELVLVDGVHDMKQPKRVAAYEWFNRWFDKEAEGKTEAVLQPENFETLKCTESGNTIISLGGETGQTLNAKRAGKIYKRENDPAKLKERIAKRIGFTLDQGSKDIKVHSMETVEVEDISVEKLTYESESGITIPTLLIKPGKIKEGSPVYYYISDQGKPGKTENSGLPFLLAKNGFIVIAIDVRGIGETSPTLPLSLNKYMGYTPLLWRNDVLAIQSFSFGRTTLGMRTLDVIKGIDLLNSRKDLKNRKIVMVGEGLGGLWALLASVYDPRIDGVVTVGTLPSYKMLVTNQYYNVWGYFWVPGALRDFDIPDLARLVSPKPQIWIDPVNALGEKLDFAAAASFIGTYKNMKILVQDNKPAKDILQPLITIFD